MKDDQKQTPEVAEHEEHNGGMTNQRGMHEVTDRLVRELLLPALSR